MEGLVQVTIINTGERDTDLIEGYFVCFNSWTNKLRGCASGSVDVNQGTAVGNDRLPQRIRAHGSWQGRFFTQRWVTNHPAAVRVVLQLYEASRPDKPHLVKVPRLMELDELAKAVLKKR